MASGVGESLLWYQPEAGKPRFLQSQLLKAELSWEGVLEEGKQEVRGPSGGSHS